MGFVFTGRVCYQQANCLDNIHVVTRYALNSVWLETITKMCLQYLVKVVLKYYSIYMLIKIRKETIASANKACPHILNCYMSFVMH